MSNRKHSTGCIEAGYAVVYLVGLCALGVNLSRWFNDMSGGLAEGSAVHIPEVLLFACIVISLIQFCRIYHYVHEFDRHQHDDGHFVFHFQKLYRFLDRFFRWGAGLCVIFMVEKIGPKTLENHQSGSEALARPQYSSLEIVPLLLLITFVLLLIWDTSFWWWRRNSSDVIASNPALENSIEVYEPWRKMQQRFLGVIFSLSLVCLLKHPTSESLPYIFGWSLGIFLWQWILDYIPPRWRFWSKEQRERPPEASGNIIREVFSPILTIQLLFSPSQPETQSTNT